MAENMDRRIEMAAGGKMGKAVGTGKQWDTSLDRRHCHGTELNPLKADRPTP